MRKNRIDLIDREPWHKNYPSPMAKWLVNFSVLGFYWFGKPLGLLWFLFLNPAMVLLYISATIVFLLVHNSIIK